MKEDITGYSDQELSLLVFNDEYWYKQRRNVKLLMYGLSECFVFTQEQADVLKQDLQDEEE